MTSREELRALTRRAADVLEQAVDADLDFADWLAGVLATVAARQGSSWALVARRPGSWESGLVLDLLRGTVGYDDDLLSNYLAADEDES